MRLKTLTLTLILTALSYFGIYAPTYAADNTAPPTTTTASQSAPDIAGVYRFTTLKRINLSQGADPLGDYKIFKGKLMIERLNDTTFLVFKAQTVRNSGTFGYNSIFEYIDGAFREKLTHMDDGGYVGNLDITFTNDQITLVLTEAGEYEETTTWKRIDPVQETKDQYLEKHLTQAQKDFDEYGLEKYKALRAKVSN